MAVAEKNDLIFTFAHFEQSVMVMRVQSLECNTNSSVAV